MCSLWRCSHLLVQLVSLLLLFLLLLLRLLLGLGLFLLLLLRRLLRLNFRWYMVELIYILTYVDICVCLYTRVHIKIRTNDTLDCWGLVQARL